MIFKRMGSFFHTTTTTTHAQGWRWGWAAGVVWACWGCAAMHPTLTEATSPAAMPAPLAPMALPEAIARLLPVPALLLGEQHNAPQHHAIEHSTVAHLAARHQLAALVLEMADDGTSTEHLAPTATPTEVQAALRWRAAAWPWADYGPTIMRAVQAGVPVLGANLPRAEMAAVMGDASWDGRIPASELPALHAQLDAAHCSLLPPAQIPGMARIQIARDARMARTLERWGSGSVDAAHHHRTVVLVAGQAHVLRERGIALHTPHPLAIVVMQTDAQPPTAPGAADAIITTPAPDVQDECAPLRTPPARTSAP